VLAIVLALGAAGCWGLADFGAALKCRRLGVLPVLLWVEGVGVVAVLAIIIATGEPLPDGRTLLMSAIAGAAGLTALGVFYKALAVGTMSIVAPISATGVTLPVVVGLVTGDTLHTVVAAGLAVTFAGVLLASREEVVELSQGGSHGGRGGPNRTAILLALVSAVGFGLYFVFADVAADGSILWLLVAGRMTALPFVALLAWRRGDALAPAPVERLHLAALGAVDVSATGLYGLAATRGELSVVSVVGALYPVVTVLLARGVLGERISRLQAAGVTAALLGVVMVSGG
jgi:drug/metabolite transporter (DMT)-like permease